MVLRSRPWIPVGHFAPEFGSCRVMKTSLWLVPALVLIAFSACRKVPAPSCVKGCEEAEQSCNYEGVASSDRERQCEKRKEECIQGCPKK